MGNGILNNKELLAKAGEPISELKKEKWTQTKYMIFEKCPDSKSVYDDKQKEWQEACELM